MPTAKKTLRSKSASRKPNKKRKTETAETFSRLSNSRDVLEIVVNKLPIGSVIMLCVVNKDLNQFIRTYKTFWVEYMCKQFYNNSLTLPTSLAVRVPNFLPRAIGRCLLGRIWKIEDIDMTQHKHFGDFARKYLTMNCRNRCGLCGTSRRRHTPFWSLGTRLCDACLRENLISNRALFYKYGIFITKSYSGKKSLMEEVTGNAFYFLHNKTASERTQYSENPVDFPGGTVSTVFFWKPHLDKIVDLPAMYKHNQEQRIPALLKLQAILKRSFVQQQRPKRIKDLTNYILRMHLNESKPRLRQFWFGWGFKRSQCILLQNICISETGPTITKTMSQNHGLPFDAPRTAPSIPSDTCLEILLIDKHHHRTKYYSMIPDPGDEVLLDLLDNIMFTAVSISTDEGNSGIKRRFWYTFQPPGVPPVTTEITPLLNFMSVGEYTVAVMWCPRPILECAELVC